MSIKYKGTTVANTTKSGGSGVSMDQVNTAIQEAVANIDTGEVYSTEEVRIGTWIDGKPLYRKVIETTSPDTAAVRMIANIGSGKDIVHISGVIINPKNKDRFDINMIILFVSPNQWISTYVSGNGGVYMAVSGDPFLSKPVCIRIEYTKTTDVATVSTFNTISTPEIPATAVTAADI